MRALFMAWTLLIAAACGSAEAAASGFDLLRGLIDTQQITSVEALVAALPQDLRSHYVLVFASRSLQGASFAQPRAILYGENAQLVVSFNGDPSQRGYQAVETMEFEAASNRFIFREIDFASGAARISEPNPARCVACHDRPARPIWDTPPEWPGSYGERYGAGLSPAETRGIAEFLAVQPQHPRYRHLLGAAAFAERTTYLADARTRYGGGAVESPNSRLSMLLASLNVRMILSQLVAAPAFNSHRYALLGAAGGSCGPLAAFYPSEDWAAREPAVRSFTQAIGAADQLQSMSKKLRKNGAAAAHGLSFTELAALRFVVENDLSVPTQHWTLALERGTYDLSAPEGSVTLEQALFAYVLRTDPALRDLSALRTYGPDDKYCEHLRRESRRALAAKPAAIGSAAGPPVPNPVLLATMHAAEERRPALLERCGGCHDGDTAPSLPFADEQNLTASLRAGGYPRGRLLDEILYRVGAQAGADSMPRGLNVTDGQRRELEEYFLSLAVR